MDGNERRPEQERTKMRSLDKGHRGARLALVLLALAGCVESDGGGLLIVQAQIPTVEEGSCIIPAMRSEVRRLQGTLDVALDRAYPYHLYPLVSNQLPKLGTEMGLEPNRVDVNVVEVELQAPPGIDVPWSASCPATFDQPIARTVLAPGDEASMSVEVIRPCHAALFRQMFMANQLPKDMGEQVRFRVLVRARGRHGSTSLRSDPFEFPVRVCFGCSQTGYPDPDFAQYAFPAIASCSELSANPYQGNRCNIGQDSAPVLCCTRDAEGKDLECPGIPRRVP